MLMTEIEIGLLVTPQDLDVMYVGQLSVDVEPEAQEEVAAELRRGFGCAPVFIAEDLKEKYYKVRPRHTLFPIYHDKQVMLWIMHALPVVFCLATRCGGGAAFHLVMFFADWARVALRLRPR